MSGFHLFAYGTLRPHQPAAAVLKGCTHVGPARIHGILYDIDGEYPALLMYGDAVVHGDVWACPAELLLRLDEYEGVADGLFRRVAVEAVTGRGRTPCWTYAAGPALSRKLLADRRIPEGRWPPG